MRAASFQRRSKNSLNLCDPQLLRAARRSRNLGNKHSCIISYIPAAAIGRFCAARCGPQKAAAQAYRVRYYKTLKVVKISEISEKNIFLIRFIFNFKLFCVD